MKAVGGLKVGLERNYHKQKKRYAPQGAKDTSTSQGKGCHYYVWIQKRKAESKFSGKVKLTHNPNQSWNTYRLGI